MPEPIKIDEKGNITIKINLKVFLKVIIILSLAIGAGFLPFQELTTSARICLMIFIGAAGQIR